MPVIKQEDLVELYSELDTLKVDKEKLQKGFVALKLKSNKIEKKHKRNRIAIILLLIALISSLFFLYFNYTKSKLVIKNNQEKQLVLLDSIQKLTPLISNKNNAAVVYSIQLGVFKKLQTPKQLKGLSPVFYDVLPTGKYQYFYGRFSSLRKAVSIKNGLLLRGFNRASVISKETIIERPSPKSIADVNNQKHELMPAEVSTSFKKISELKGSFYSVQIGVFKDRVTPKQLLGVRPVFYETLPNLTTRYIAGNFYLKKDAKTAKNNIVAKGIKDAYIVAYKDGQKITPKELDAIRKKAKIKSKG